MTQGNLVAQLFSGSKVIILGSVEGRTFEAISEITQYLSTDKHNQFLISL